MSFFECTCLFVFPLPSHLLLLLPSLLPPFFSAVSSPPLPSPPSAQLLPGLPLGSPCRPAGGQQRAALCSERPRPLSAAGRRPRPHFLSPDLGPPRGRCGYYTGTALLGMLSGARVLSSEGRYILVVHDAYSMYWILHTNSAYCPVYGIRYATIRLVCSR